MSLFQAKITPVASALPCASPWKQAHAGPGQPTETKENFFLASLQDRHLTDLRLCCGRERLGRVLASLWEQRCWAQILPLKCWN